MIERGEDCAQSGEGYRGKSSQSLIRFLGSRIQNAERSIPEDGLPLAVNRELLKSGIHVIPEYPSDTLRLLKYGPIIVVGTHPHVVDDSFGILASIPAERRDISIVAHEMYQDLGPNVREHIIPMYGRDKKPTDNYRERLRRKFVASDVLNDLSKEESGRKNIEGIQIAAQRLMDGGIVVIFPDGPGAKGVDWEKGVGRIVRKVRNHDVNVVYATTIGQEWRNRARIASSKAGFLLGSTDLHVRFSNPHHVSEIADGSVSNSVATRIMEKQYEEFLKRI